MNMLQEFKAFAVKSNVVDMAVGIIIGAAFGKIVSSLVEDIILPPIGLLIGGVNFYDLAVTLQEATAGSAAVTIRKIPTDDYRLHNHRFYYLFGSQCY